MVTGQRENLISIDQIEILDLQPSQLYISEEKMKNVQAWFFSQGLQSFRPLPIKKLGDKLVLTDGHTRAWVAYQAGFKKVPLTWEKDELDWEAYRLCVEECNRRGVYTVADFCGRVLPDESYKKLWLAWCRTLRK